MMNNAVQDPWDVQEEDFPKSGSASDKLTFLLNYAVLAPSGHNTQPWLFRVKKDYVDLYADRTAALPVVDPNDRELTMSCGAALFNLRVALRYFGYIDEVQLFSDPKQPDYLARVRLGQAHIPTDEEKALFKAIPKRRTNRSAYEDRPVPDTLLAELKMAAHQEGGWLYVVELDGVRDAVADLIAEGDRMQWASREYRRELSAWTHPNRSLRRDGIPGYAQGVSDLASLAGPLVIRTFDLGNGQAAKDRDLAMKSPGLVVLGSEKDGVGDWVAAGQALERVLLRARAVGVWASYLNQVTQISELRLRLANIIDQVGFPQVVLRLGYGPEVRPTPRRRVSDVLIESFD